MLGSSRNRERRKTTKHNREGGRQVDNEQKQKQEATTKLMDERKENLEKPNEQFAIILDGFFSERAAMSVWIIRMKQMQ